VSLARPDASRRIVLSATLTAVSMVAQQVGGTATRDALFLSHHPAAELPKVMIAAAALSLVAVRVTSAAYPRIGPARVVPFAFGVNALLYFLEYVFVPRSPGVASVVVYLHASVVGAVVISGFWSVVNERFDPYTAKRVIGGIAAGAALGGVLGGVVAERVATWFDVRTMLVVLGALNAVCGLAILQVGAPQRTPSSTEPVSGLAALREAPYLRQLARLVGGVALTAAVLNYVFKAEAAASFQTGEELMSFFALFYASTSIATFLLQSVASGRVLEKLGLGATIAILPISVIALGTLGAAFTRLWTVIALRATESVLVNSLFRSGYELLYTPVARNLKRPAKTIIDVAFDRIGDAMGSALVLSVLFLAPPAAHSWLIGGATVSAAFVAWTALQLHLGYVAQLADSLRSGALRLDERDVVDATTRRTYAMTAVAIDRDELLREIEAFRSTRASSEISPGGIRSGAISTAATPSDADRQRSRVTDRVAALVSGDPTRAIQALREPFDPRLASHAIPLLGHDGTARQAAEALRRIAPWWWGNWWTRCWIMRYHSRSADAFRRCSPCAVRRERQTGSLRDCRIHGSR
jgi:ATP:ADP antiporter, AAA family